MPQMAPMNWLTLYFLFSFLFLLMNILNYYNFLYPTNYSNHLSYKKMKFNWKW
uniref:ATP synthase complex subunit 8 n=1 Tax=Cryptorhynchinae sp. 8 ACP-2013 TaxID=1434469 RepID=A0A3G3ME47_9CUCU|nr:ATP synthase F0 subunit 8 [Cryptorhynchinae sp. 8 ACP-2013]